MIQCQYPLHKDIHIWGEVGSLVLCTLLCVKQSLSEISVTDLSKAISTLWLVMCEVLRQTPCTGKHVLS